MLRSIIKSIKHERNINKKSPSVDLNYLSSTRQKIILNEIVKSGYSIIPDFYTAEQCAELINEIERLLVKVKDKVWVDSFHSDHRIFGANHLSETIQSFYDNSFINEIIYAYEGTNNRVGFVLAAKLNATEENLGSGQGWHRDNPANKQTKAILYLTDTDMEHGPFQYIKGSHKSVSVVYNQINYGFKFNQNRFEEADINKLISNNPSLLETVIGKAGTLIITDTRGIHRGMPIKAGTRYALTDYLWFNMAIPAHVNELIIYK